MAREDRLVPRLAVPIALVVLAVLGAMATSERLASVVAAHLHLAAASDVQAAREEARTARYEAAGVLGFQNMFEELHTRQAEFETQMSELSADYDKRFHGPFPQDRLEDLDKQLQDVQGRLTQLEQRVSTACTRTRPRC
jgi:nucleoside-diphosphate-sugar epimerase